MTPFKSVTAVIGVTASPDCAYNKCAACTNTACAFRAEMEAPDKVRESAGAEGSGSLCLQLVFKKGKREIWLRMF